MSKIKLLQGLASLFKGKGKDVAKTTLPDTTSNISNVFTKNIIDEFGQDEVKKVFKIIGDKDKDPQLAKLFFKPNESRLDEVVNMLESRYMGSERLQAHSISFKRRGSGAAERYLRLNDSGARLTDLPGGPGDRVLYYKHYGEMSGTRNLEGKSVFKNEKPTIFDEGTMLTDEGKTIEGFAMPTDDLSPLVKDMEKMAAEAKAMTEFAKRDQLQISNALDTFNRMIDDGEDPAEALKMLKELMKRTKNAEGGRVGMFMGGVPAGIMQAAKLAQKGIKPFGKKQTYKQKVTKAGEDEFQKAMKQHFDKELYNINKVRGGNPEAELFDLYEEIASKQRYSMLPEATRSKMLSEIDESLKAMDVDGGDYQNFRSYLFDEYGFPNETAFKETGSNVIPFKPREKKFKGGLLGLLKRINPQLEKDMVKTGPFQTGHRADAIADMDQIKNIARNEATDLERIYELEDMIQSSPRYNETMKKAFFNLIDYEKFRANILYDNPKLQRIMKNDPEGTENFLRRIFKEGGGNEFNLGGLVPPQRGPMSEGMGTLYRSK
jgi:hypothetical protein